jgi:hypothetical protein
MSDEPAIRANAPPYISCGGTHGCDGRGIVRGPIDEATGRRIVREHGRCNGAGILILRRFPHGRTGYRAPKLS